MYYPEARTPSQTDLRLIKGAGHIAVIAIEGERSQEAFRSAFDEIRNSEAKLRKIIDTIPTLAWSARTDGSAEFLNQHYLDYVGLSAEQASDWGWIVVADLKQHFGTSRNNAGRAGIQCDASGRPDRARTA